MKKLSFLIVGFTISGYTAFAQKKVWDFGMQEAQISHNYSEYDRQTSLKNNQTLSTATQTAARSQGNDFKDKVKIIHARLVSLSVLISDGKVIFDSYDIVKDILNYQRQILSTIGSDPKLAPLALFSESALVNRSSALIKYIELMVIAASDLNAMKSTDRRAIVGYIVNELRVIRGDAYSINQSLKWAQEGNYINSINPWARYVNDDKRLADDILHNLKF
ncbi:MAG: hypothetical protein V4456_11360 [Bacteroidota bacterium]